jgi:hypothetical protein
VKKAAQLVLFFSIAFILSLLIATGVRYLFSWIEVIRAVPGRAFYPVGLLVTSFQMALSTALYCAVLLSLSYSVRRKMAAGMSIILLFLLASGLTFGFSLALRRVQAVESPAAASARPTLGGPGLRLRSGDVTIIMTGDPSDESGPRVVAMPDRPLIFQENPAARGAVPGLPSAPFYESRPAFMSELEIDFTLVSEQLYARLRMGVFQFCLYALSIILFLVSCRFVFELSSWPLANIFLGFLVFRGILAFQTFLDSEEIQRLILFFIGRLIPRSFISPFIYLALALLILLYTILTNAARGRRASRG